MFEMAVLLDALSTAALDVADINSSVSAANAAAVAPTTGISVAAGDEVSAAIAALLSSYGREYRALSAEVAVFHSQFVHALTPLLTPTRRPRLPTPARYLEQ